MNWWLITSFLIGVGLGWSLAWGAFISYLMRKVQRSFTQGYLDIGEFRFKYVRRIDR